MITKTNRWKLVLKIALPLLILAIGAAGAYQVSRTGPEARRKKPKKPLPLVNVVRLHSTTEQVVVSAMGTVIPSRELQLRARVAGQVIAVHREFTEGGIVNSGEELVRLDPVDYRLAVEKQKTRVVNARYALKLEMGQQAVAEREWQLVNGKKPANPLDEELALRKPHLEKARADLASAEADLKQARLDLSRTRVYAPFNAVVLSKRVETGSQVSTQDELAQLAGTDEFRIEISVPMDDLKWIVIPSGAGEPGSSVRIFYGNNTEMLCERTGRVIRLLGELETEGRMVRILAAVKDPLDINASTGQKHPLLIGQYVRVEIEGDRLNQVFSIPRTALRNYSFVWIAGSDGKLHIRSVEIVRRGEETVLVKDGLADGERLIVSDLPAPVEGMQVMVAADG